MAHLVNFLSSRVHTVFNHGTRGRGGKQIRDSATTLRLRLLLPLLPKMRRLKKCEPGGVRFAFVIGKDHVPIWRLQTYQYLERAAYYNDAHSSMSPASLTVLRRFVACG